MIIDNPKLILQKSLEDSCGLTAYLKTLDIYSKDVSSDTEYQKNFTSYYKVRRDQKWLEKYYIFLESHKNDTDLTFETVIRYLSNIPHKVNKKMAESGFAVTVEASFASKLLATINPDFPIWDSQVVRALGYKIDGETSFEERINEYIKTYAKLTEEVKTFIDSEQGQICIQLFDELFPNHKHISDLKKIDFYLWNIGK